MSRNNDSVQQQQRNSSKTFKLLPTTVTCRVHRVAASDSLGARMPTSADSQTANDNNDINNECGYDNQLGRSSASILHPASRFHNGAIDNFNGDVCLKNTTTPAEESPLLNLHNFVHGTEQFFHAFSQTVPPTSIQNSTNNNNNNDGGIQQTRQNDTAGSINDDNNNNNSIAAMMNKPNNNNNNNNCDVIDNEVDGGRSSSSSANNNNNNNNSSSAANLQQEKNSTGAATATVVTNSSSTSSSSASSSSAEFLELDGISSGSAKKANKASAAATPFVLYPPPTNNNNNNSSSTSTSSNSNNAGNVTQATQFTSLSPNTSNISNGNNNPSNNPRNVKLAGAASLASYRSHPYASPSSSATTTAVSSSSSSSGNNNSQQQNLFPYGNNNNTIENNNNSNVSPNQHHEAMNSSAAAAAAAAAAAIGTNFFHPAYRDFEQQQQQFMASSQTAPAQNWQASTSSAAAGYNNAANMSSTRPPPQPPQPMSMLPSPSGVGPGTVGQVGPMPGNYQASNVLPYLYLLNRDLWVKFNRHGNEMIVTKQGRRMFPSLIVKIAGLQPHAAYHLYVEVVQADPHQWKFTNGRWMANGIADIDPPEQPSPNAIYHHPESPCSGAEWMSRKIDFCSMKLTNDRTTTSGHIVLNSMRKYVPRIHVIEMPIGTGGILSPNQLMLGPNGLIDSKTPHWTFTFPETAFIAVTTYQNPVVTQLKIENNPFAKGFRDSDRDTRPVVTSSTASTVAAAAAAAAAATTTTTDGGGSNNSHHHNNSHNNHHHNHHSSSSSSSNRQQHQHQTRATPPPNGGTAPTRNNTSSALSAGGGSSDSSSPLSASEIRLQQQQQQQGQVAATSSYNNNARHSQTPVADLLLTGDHGGGNLFSTATHLGPLTPNTSRSMMASWSQSVQPLCNPSCWSAQAMLDAAVQQPPTAIQLAQLNQHTTSLGIYSPISPASAAAASSSLGLFGPSSSSPATVFNFGQNTPPGSGGSIIWPQSMQSAYSTGQTTNGNQFAILGPGVNNSTNSSSCALAAVMPATGSSMATSSMMQSVINAADPTSAFSHLAWADGGASFYQ